MKPQQKILRLVNPLRQKGTAAEIGVDALHQAAMGLSDRGKIRPRLKAKDLVGLLLCHGARLSRASLPRGVVRLRVVAPAGHAAVKIRLQ